jgi:hypothetical protein
MSPDREIREDCGMARRNLEAYVLAQLPPQHRAPIDEHLRACTTCRDEARATARLLRQLRALAPAMPVAAPPATSAPRRRSYRSLLAPEWALIAAASVCAVLTVVGVRAARPDRPAPRTAVAERPLTVELAHERDRAVSYLLEAQWSDGSWVDGIEPPDAFDLGLTALASLALLSSADGDSAALDAARRGFGFVDEQMQARSRDAQRPGTLDVQVEAAAAHALAAAARRWPGRFTAAAKGSLRSLVERLGPGGSFANASRGAGAAELTTVLAWCALEEGRRAGFKVKGLEHAADRARAALPASAATFSASRAPEALLFAALLPRRTVAEASLGIADAHPQQETLDRLARQWTAEADASDPRRVLRMAALLLALSSRARA